MCNSNSSPLGEQGYLYSANVPLKPTYLPPSEQNLAREEMGPSQQQQWQQQWQQQRLQKLQELK